MLIINTPLPEQGEDRIRDFVAELLISEVTLAESLEAGFSIEMPCHITRELGLPPETIKKVEGTIIETVREAMDQLDIEQPNLLFEVRFYYSKKVAHVLSQMKSSKPGSSERSMELVQEFTQSKIPLNGGWGYFLVERGKDSLENSNLGSRQVIELYLYKEGE